MLNTFCKMTCVTATLSAFLLLLGCQNTASVAKSESSPPKTSASSAFKGQGPHVSLSSHDLSLELDKHCNSAKESLRKATSLADGDSISGGKLSDLKSELLKADKEMTECTLMVHGVYEQAIGEPKAEKK